MVIPWTRNLFEWLHLGIGLSETIKVSKFKRASDLAIEVLDH
jgi:hypothetical protein